MPVAVVDTGVAGMADADDGHHDPATEIVRGMNHGHLQTGRVTNHVLLERSIGYTSGNPRDSRRDVRTAEPNQSAGFEVLHAAQKDFSGAVDLFRIHDGLSLGDASIAARMQREGIEYLYLFDDDFDALGGVTRLGTPDNPFT